FQLKHFVADFPLQMNFMLTKKVSPNWDFLLPLLAHCAVHALLTTLICLYYAPQLWYLGFVDLGIHFLMDRIKASPNYLGRFNNISKSSFWWALGFDQMIHHLTHIFIIYVITREL